jgi:two-component system chemotaxis response regulator CheY
MTTRARADSFARRWSDRAQQPDLVVLDVRLGDEDGLVTLEQLRAEGLLAAVPIVVVSILADTATRSRATAAGVEHFVPKPFSPGRLQALVENLLAAR